MRYPRRLLFLLLALVVAGGLAAAWRLVWSRPVVEVVRPTRREVVELVVATGRLKPVRQSPVGPEVSGVVERVLVEAGDRVVARQPLVLLARADVQQKAEQARLAVETARRELARTRAGPQAEEVRRAEAEAERAEAALDQAERDHVRTRMLHARELIARADLDRAETALEQARAAREAARQALEALRSLPRPEDLRVAEARLREAEAALRTAEVEITRRTIAAPFDGLVIQRRVEPGQSVTPGQVLVTLGEMSRTELLVETDENNLGRLRVGQRATVVAPAYAAQPFEAVLRQIGPEVDSQRGVVSLRLDPVSLPAYARPDMTVDVSIEVARVPDALSVPASSLLERASRAFVLTVRDGRTEEVPVRVRGRNPEWAGIEGLAPDALVVRRATEVGPDRRVRVRETGP